MTEHGYGGIERRSDAITHDSLKARIFGQDISVTGQFSITVFLLVVSIAANWVMHDKDEARRESIESDARLEVEYLKEQNRIITAAINRSCLGLVVDVEAQQKALDVWYKNRKEHIEKQKQQK